VVANTLAERKAEIAARADAFIVLPGGYGTLEELVEVLGLRQLGLHTRPIVLINVNNFWRPFLQQTRPWPFPASPGLAKVSCSLWRSSPALGLIWWKRKSPERRHCRWLMTLSLRRRFAPVG
jgi:hypothetical protein